MGPNRTAKERDMNEKKNIKEPLTFEINFHIWKLEHIVKTTDQNNNNFMNFIKPCGSMNQKIKFSDLIFTL